MVDWTASMQQTFEYYIVDPDTWTDAKLVNTVKSSTISRDSSAETLGSATIDIAESVGECYVRIYLITIQNGVRDKHPLGTFLVQTPSSKFSGRLRTVSMDAYTPLLELKENQPPIGFSILGAEDNPDDANIMSNAYKLTRANVRAPVVKPNYAKTLQSDFVADPQDTWLSYINALIANAKYTFGLDEIGRILFAPKQDTASLQPVWTYDDSNSSILYPELDMEHDLYEIPNVVEVLYSKGDEFFYAKVVNDDPNSPISTVSRGREITYRVSDPDLVGDPGDAQIQEYAKNLLKEKSTLEYTIKYTHGYCPVRLGDCVRLNYTRAGLTNIKAKVVSQSIKCVPGCPVTETAVFTTRLWG